jgi:nitrate/nitrite transport system substrate-binding protein
MNRRDFLRGAAGVAAGVGAAGFLAACAGSDAATGKATSASKSSRKVRLGFIALTDCASIVMAKELGYFAERDLDVSVEKQASWAVTRDNLLTGQIDGAHCLFGMPFSVATGIGGKGSQALKIAMVLNNNGQAITMAKDYLSVGYGDLARARAALLSKKPTLAMTFPGGTHDIWLRYWLKAAKVDAKTLKIITIPPPQMVANMSVGNMDGYCVGEPWNAVAVQKKIGFTHIATQDIWTHHPEKALVVNETFATQRKDVLVDVMGAVLKASRWLDDLANRKSAAKTIGAAAYVNAPAADIEGRLLGRYDIGSGIAAKTFTDDMMMYFRGGETNAPRRSHAVWFMSQYRRLGYLTEDPAYQQLADSIVLRDLYEEVAAKEKIDVPSDDMAPFSVKLDGVTFDPTKPQEEAVRP